MRGIVPGREAKRESHRAPRLTERREQILAFIRQFMHKNGFSPSLREIKTGVGLNSFSTIWGHVLALELLGYLKVRRRAMRGIVLVDGDPTETDLALSRLCDELLEFGFGICESDLAELLAKAKARLVAV